MSNIHYFQRYKSKENWITNSTQLLLSRLYHYSRQKFEKVLNTILNESNVSLNIGVNFTQQEKGEFSVVDGIISQDSFKIAIETKLYDNFSLDQLKRHLAIFNDSNGRKILLSLSKNKVDNNIRKQIFTTIKSSKYSDIRFASITYENIIEIIQSNLAEHDIEMQEILDDYIAICSEHQLITLENSTMLVFSAGESLKENLTYNIYYDPVNRKHNIPFKYIGLYSDKTVKAIGKISKIVYCDYEDGKLIPTDNEVVFKILATDEQKRIKSIIETTKYYDLRKDVKFFLVDKFYEINFKKTSSSPLRAKKYFYLNDIDGFDEAMSVEKIARLLDDNTWE